MYKYFVSYNVSTHNKMGFGHVETCTDIEIAGIDDIREIAKSIERDFNFPKGSVAIIYYRLF